jgi:hypothetical protein
MKNDMTKKIRKHGLKGIFAAAAAGGAFMLPSAAMAQSAAGAALAVGPVAFGLPWLLAGGVALPLIWWLLRTVPQKPLQEKFPAIRLLFNLKSEDQEPASIPLWHRVLRMTAAAAVIGGLAQPMLNPDKPLAGSGPVVLVIDNGWSSARSWQARTEELKVLIDRAGREGRSVVTIATAAPSDGGPVAVHGPVSAGEAQQIIDNIQPQPWPVSREAVVEALDAANIPADASVIWLSNGLDDPGTQALAKKLQEMGPLTVLEDSPNAAPHLLVPPDPNADSITVTVRRPDASGQDSVTLTASAEDGSAIDQVRAEFKPGEYEAKVTFEVPVEMRNQLARVAVDGENSAGAVVLLDERWRRRPVGIITTGAESSQPLLTETSYIERALSPYVDLGNGSVDEVLKRPLAVLVMTDSVTLDAKSHEQVEKWVEDGGTLLRFAGPRLAANPNESFDADLLPVPLRIGERVLGGQLSGTKPAKIAPFDENSPFKGIAVPENVTVSGEVLAQPSGDLDEKTWARLEDGTPLVTAAQKGKGWVILVHTTPNTDWSNLSLSGLFVDMNRAIVAHSQGVASDKKSTQVLPPLKTLDAKGQLGDPPASARALQPDATVSVRNPPGFYGDDSTRQALDLAPTALPDFRKIPALPDSVERKTYQDATRQTDLSGPLLGGAMALLLADLFILLRQRGLMPSVPGANRRRREKAAPAPKREP